MKKEKQLQTVSPFLTLLAVQQSYLLNVLFEKLTLLQKVDKKMHFDLKPLGVVLSAVTDHHFAHINDSPLHLPLFQIKIPLKSLCSMPFLFPPILLFYINSH